MAYCNLISFSSGIAHFFHKQVSLVSWRFLLSAKTILQRLISVLLSHQFSLNCFISVLVSCFAFFTPKFFLSWKVGPVTSMFEVNFNLPCSRQIHHFSHHITGFCLISICIQPKKLAWKLFYYHPSYRFCTLILIIKWIK